MVRRDVDAPRAGETGRAVVAAALVLTACHGETRAPPPAREGPAVERRVVGELVVEWEVSGALEDTTLLGTGPLAADAGGVSVVDPLRHAVLRFDRSGVLRWTFGRRGAGPDEFLRPLDVRVDGAGRTWVLDDRNLRVTVVGPDGVPAFRIPLGGLGGIPNGLVPLSGDRALVALLDPERPLAVVRRDGTLAARERFPWTAFGRLDAIRGQFAIASLAGSDRWVAAFVFQDAFLGFTGLSFLGYLGSYVEAVPPPVVEERSARRGRSEVRERTLVSALAAARAATASPTRLYVLFGGASADRDRVVDAYRPETGEYVESVRLPRRAARVTWGDGRLYATGADPLPFVLALRGPDGALP